MKYEIETLEMEKLGAAFTRGALVEILKLACLFLVCFLTSLIVFAFYPIDDFNPIDDCDVSKFDRCGLKVRVDNKTGIEYLETSNGGIIRRYDR